MIETAIVPKTVSLETQGSFIVGAALSMEHGKPVIDSLFEVEPPLNVKPLYMDPAIQKLTAIVEERCLVISTPGSSVIQRTMELSLTKDSDIEEVLPYESENVIPFQTDESVVDKIILSRSLEQTTLCLFASKKEQISKLLDRWNEYQLDPEYVSPASQALMCFCHTLNLSETPLLVLHAGDNEICLCLILGKHVLATASTEPLFAGEDHDKPRDELTRLATSLIAQNPDLSIDSIITLGPSRDHPAIAAFINGLSLEQKPLQGFGLEQEQLSRFSLAIGGALLGLPIYKDSRVNLRQGSLAFPDPLKRFKKPMALYLGLCGTLAITVAFLGSLYVSDMVRQSAQELTQLVNIAKEVYPGSKLPPSVGFNPEESVSSSELSYRVNLLEQQLDSAPNLFPLQPDAPLVSDVLAWLSSHPVVLGHKSDPIILESFSYNMIKRPEINKTKEHYRIKVELEFSCSTPKRAREFHDALLLPNAFVDTNEEVKWTSGSGRYKTSFYLKDKTRYKGRAR